MKSVSFSQEEKAEKPKVSREQALRVARQLGCRGAHESENGNWMPCGSMEEFVGIQKGKEEYLIAKAKKKSALTTIEYRTKKFSEKSFAYYEDKEQALQISKIRGCGSVRTVILNGRRYYSPCDPKPPKDGWEDFGQESGVIGISNTADGGLVSTPIAGKSDESTEKGFVPNVSRSTDPDTFSDPDSARIRARNLGCIGIRRYTARDGKLVWMPCSNGSDYNKRMGIRGDNSPKDNPRSRRKGKSVFDESLVSLKGVPKPKKKSPIIDSDIVNNLAIKVRKHNASAKKDGSRTNLRDVKIVFMRGLEDSDEKGAFRRVSDFLSLLINGKPKDSKYREDNDLLPLDHPLKNSKSSVKSDLFDEGSYGVKFDGCCPKVIKRHRKV
jgi:hypothetical protein